MACGACANGWFSVVPCGCDGVGKAEFTLSAEWVTVPGCACKAPCNCKTNVARLQIDTSHNKTPHKCPVCHGIGKYIDVTCNACKGEGVVWG